MPYTELSNSALPGKRHTFTAKYTTYEYQPTGGITFGGAAVVEKGKIGAVSGGVIFSGAATCSFTSGGVGKSGVSRLASIDAQRAADRKKKRRVTYAVDEQKVEAKQAEPEAPTQEAKPVEVKREVREKVKPPVETLKPDLAREVLTAVEKAINRRKKALPAKEAVDQPDVEELARAERAAETLRLELAEKARLESEAKAKAEAKVAIVRQAEGVVAKVGSLALEMLAAGVRAKLIVEVRKVEGLEEDEMMAIVDARMEVMTTEEMLAIAAMEAEKRHKKQMMKMMALLS